MGPLQSEFESQEEIGLEVYEGKVEKGNQIKEVDLLTLGEVKVR